MNGFVTHHGRCHCGAVRFEVDAPARIAALDCNCSICRMTGFLHLIVPAARFRLRAGA
ncbi:MAG: GFA family protein, partial [Proteobacteria bacterium]|nr:GFA family protein [Pseudomonadota bacterium]